MNVSFYVTLQSMLFCEKIFKFLLAVSVIYNNARILNSICAIGRFDRHSEEFAVLQWIRLNSSEFFIEDLSYVSHL